MNMLPKQCAAFPPTLPSAPLAGTVIEELERNHTGRAESSTDLATAWSGHCPFSWPRVGIGPELLLVDVASLTWHSSSRQSLTFRPLAGVPFLFH